MEKTLGIYIHIPFCKAKCAYCDFYSLAGSEDQMQHYQAALLKQISQWASGAKDYLVDTIYFGGGTPTCYGSGRICALLHAIKEKFSVSPDAEITLEGNPESVTQAALFDMRQAGVNRLSFGMQSAQQAELSSVGRIHLHRDTVAAVNAARQAGIDNISLDLMYGLPLQTEESFRDSVTKAIALTPTHISCYGLKVEPQTPLFFRVQQGEQLPDDDMQAQQYLWMVEHLDAAGYHQYEISNFARKGFASRHNLKYWQMQPYLGFGTGAHSDFENSRIAIGRDLAGYLRFGQEKQLPLFDALSVEREEISLAERAGEYLMLSLRTNEGISPAQYENKYHMPFAPIEKMLQTFQNNKWTRQRANGNWQFTPEGFLLSNTLLVSLLETMQ